MEHCRQGFHTAVRRDLRTQRHAQRVATQGSRQRLVRGRDAQLGLVIRAGRGGGRVDCHGVRGDVGDEPGLGLEREPRVAGHELGGAGEPALETRITAIEHAERQLGVAPQRHRAEVERPGTAESRGVE